jgi:tetratricopeptide (TPR) repeat protein
MNDAPTPKPTPKPTSKPTSKPTLGLCMIVRDEERLLPDCLAIVVGCVDGVVIVDTGSIDRTVELAQAFNAQIPTQVHHFTWCDDFSAARNYALQFVTSDWVLVLDADERLNPALAEALREAISDPTHLVINLMRQEIGATQSPYSLVSRLFRRHPEIHFRRPYHAMIDDAVEQLLQREPHWHIVTLETVAIFHEGYQAELITSRDKVNKARQTMERFFADNPNDPYVCSKLGALYCDVGEIDRGKTLLETGLKSPNLDPNTCYELHYHLGSICAQQGEIQAADDHYQTAIEQKIPDKLKLGAIVNWGVLRQTHGDLETAEWIYGEAIGIDPTCAIAHYNLGITLRAAGKFQAAIQHYQTALLYQPDNAEIYQNLGVVQMQLGQTSESLLAFQQAIELHRQKNTPESHSESERIARSLSEMGFTD